MIVLAVENLQKHFGPEAVLDGVTFEVRGGERIGLVGPNGSGKTTLLRIIAGSEEADSGRCLLHPSVRLGCLEQQTTLESARTVWDEAQTALEELIELGERAIQVAEALGKTTDPAERRRLAARYDHLQHELDHRDAYNLDHKIERVLDGLGFSRERFRLPVGALSGGEQNRLMLAKLLLAEPDLMLLDEPSNHLDIEATGWLEDFLATSSAAMIVVSHDRYFLDKVTNRTLELFRGTVEAYAGNFSSYWRQKSERLLVQRRTYQKQQAEIAKAEDFIRRSAYGMKHAQAEDRRKKLARIRPVPPPRQITPPAMAFPEAERSGDIVLRVRGLTKAYDRPLFEDLNFEITRGGRWGMLGPNGCGKTTLLRCLLGEVPPDAGQAVIGHGVRIGYFDQQLEAALDDNLSGVDALRPDRKEFAEQHRRDLLARFGLVGDAALQSLGSLSGGQRCRAALARLAASGANFLVLDEPTNHLDLWAREALERALSEYEGTVLFVSHDRYFVNRLADHLLVAEPGRFRVIEGNYETYLHLVKRGLAGPPKQVRKEPKQSGPDKRPRKGPREQKSLQPKRRYPYRKVEDLEAEIFERETELDRLHAALVQPETHRNGERVRRLKAEIAEQRAALAKLYGHWEEATELNW